MSNLYLLVLYFSIATLLNVTVHVYSVVVAHFPI